MKKILLFVATLAMFAACGKQPEGVRTSDDFNFEWLFSMGDDAEWADPSADDSGWRALHLPHDWAIEGEFSPENPSTPSSGALPGGIGWYRKHFVTPEGVASGAKRVAVEFDGVFMNSTVYVNGKALGTRPYGYSSFTYDMTDALNPDGQMNVIAVRCDNEEQPNSRWYAGCGIYRNVRIVTTAPVHVAWNGTYITTPEVSKSKAVVNVEVTLEGTDAKSALINNIIKTPSGKKVAESGWTSASGVKSIELKNPHLWDIKDTYLYTMETEVMLGDEVVDIYDTPFGVRTIRFDKDNGFFLNDERVELQGVCLHHDMGCIGTAVHYRALQRELEILKSYGVNAIRTSHNPPTPELLTFADEMGFLVIDEAFDMWRKHKTKYDYAQFFDEWHEKDLTDFIRRDRNHPSIIMWSIGNELGEQGDSMEDRLENLPPEQANILLNFMESFAEYQDGDDSPNVVLCRHMAALVKTMDTTRPVTAGCNSPSARNNLFKSGATDVFGINYGAGRYDMLRDQFGDTPLYGSETASAINSRGVYPQSSMDTLIVPKQWWLTYESEGNQLTAYDACRVPWGSLHEEAWVRVRDRKWLAGTFVWTGFDYIGEPTPYGWPSRSSYFGIVDLAGFPKDAYWMYKSEWTDDTVLHVFPHWNWTEGENIDIWAYYNNADEVELFVNGKSYGKDSKEGEKLHAQWLAVPYEPGKIEVVSYKNGKEVARDSQETTGEAVKLKLTPDRATISADGYDLSYVTVEAVDAQGRAVPTADFMLSFSASGDGELFGVDNGNAADTLSLKGNKKAMFSGKALAVVRSIKDQPGNIELTVNSETLGSTTATIKTR